ncbi:hypothetical protein HGRIS_000306 [Hohenbuehelia grisea]|uniref:Uncharacterized protein n=1 Tax=Hohenbuehelia grisea TaxID=104357 RepID=A0ABR3JSK2_9AGAR
MVASSSRRASERITTKGVSTDTLLTKLKALHATLAGLDQDAPKTSLANPRKDLSQMSLLMHKDPGVNAYTACGLAEILRLYAPDAPYTDHELRDIFQFFITVLKKGLTGTAAPYYDAYFLLLESLSTVKSVVLMCDLGDAEALMLEMFRTAFVLVRRELPRKLDLFLADILIAIIDESQTLTRDVIESLLSQFMEKNQRLDQPGYRLAVTICSATADRLQRHVSQYFTDIIVNHSPENDPDADEDDDDHFAAVRTAHDLIARIHRACPALLHSVVPQLEEELRVEDATLRGLATQTLGDMYAGIASGSGPASEDSASGKGKEVAPDAMEATAHAHAQDLVKKYPTTWNLWLSRRNDRVAAVRLRFVEAAGHLIHALPEFKQAVEDALHHKLLDPDEKVRAAVCRAYSRLNYEDALHHVSTTQLRAVAGRGLDRKHSVRMEALSAVGRLFGLALPEIESNDTSATEHFAWIPNEILHMVAVGTEVRPVVEDVVAKYVLPLPSASSKGKETQTDDDAASTWTSRLLAVMRHMDDKAVSALLLLSGLRVARPTIFEHFVDACVKNNGGIIDEDEDKVIRKLNAVIQHISSLFSDSHKASEDLQAFAKLNEGRLYKLLRTCMDTQTDMKAMSKASAEFIRRLEQTSATIVPTMTVVLYRASLRIVNQSTIPSLIRAVKKDQDREARRSSLTGTSATKIAAGHARVLLTHVAKHCPALFKPHVGELSKVIASEKGAPLVEAGLQALAAVVRWDEKLNSGDKKLDERVTRYALDTNPRLAKFAGRYLAFSKNRKTTCKEVAETIANNLPDADAEQRFAHLAVLAQFARFASAAFDQQSEVIMTFLLKQVLMVPLSLDADAMEDEEEWAEESDLSYMALAKLQALKVCRYRCLSHAADETALELATPVLKMLATLVEQNGSLSPDEVEDPKVLSRMRLQATVSLLHLATVEKYAAAISPKFIKLALTVQDTCYNVRYSFLSKLITLLQARKLPPRFNIIPFITIHDPEADVKAMASQYVSTAFRKMPQLMKVEQFELIFIRLLHLLAHHPDFGTSHEDLLDISKYIEFYLDLIGNNDTVSLLYHLAAKGKTVRDAESHGYSENLYMTAELAQELIKIRAHTHSWSIQSYPGKVKLPADILRPLPSAEAANKILKTVYLPEATTSWLAGLLKPTVKVRSFNC